MLVKVHEIGKARTIISITGFIGTNKNIHAMREAQTPRRIINMGLKVSPVAWIAAEKTSVNMKTV